MEKRLVIPLKEIQDGDTAAVGGKAHGLARLNRLGLSVPPGFCITVMAFRKHIESNELVGRVESALDKLNSASHEERKSVLLEIRQAIINAPLAGKLRDEIENHCHTLSADSLAVRSSATAEDLPDHSFAGQYETYLGITDLAGCIDAVKKCWASLWTQRASEYRQNNGFDHLAVNMAVIVQELVQADASGVIFTADPVNGYKSRMIIETVGGLGDTLVSGKAAPQRFVVAKKKCRIVSKNPASKSYITDSVVKKLAKLGRKIEKHFDSPQDIEWAIYKNEIYFLQSRPITVIPAKKSWAERQVWTNANTGEVAPDVVTPVTWSVIQAMLNSIFGTIWNLLCVEPGNNPIGDLVMGRIYWNINTCIGVVKHLPYWKNIDFDMAFGGEHKKMVDLGQLDIPEEDIPDLGGSLIKMTLLLPVNLSRLFSCTSKKAELFLDNLSIRNDKLQSLNIPDMSKEELLEQLTTFVAKSVKTWNLKYLFSSLCASPILYWTCNKWLADADASLANRLLAGIGNMDDAEAGLELWRLAQKIHNIPEIKKIITAGGNWEITHKRINTLDQGKSFLKSWDEFMLKHGHHTRGELELFNRRWSESPDYVLSIIRAYISSINQIDPVENHKRLGLQREQLAEQYRRQLKNPLKRYMFNLFLRKAQKGFILRESFKNEAVRSLAAFRKILLELGSRFTEQGVFTAQDDIFFLELKEIEQVVQGKAEFDIKELIISRRAEYERNKSVMPPKVIVGKFNPDTFVPETVDANIEVLKGLGVSPGIVTGKAHVILKTDDNEQISAGEILVAPFTDPGWTPYFIPAAAIVMDIGGMLSHGSVVAREYGIPAVVNVGPATKIIKTGQMIQVDANRGVVKILR